jgi:peptide deformylase
MTAEDVVSSEFMEVLDHTNPLLKEELEEFDFDNPTVDPEELAERLVATMRNSDGIGLAANQVGLNFRVFAMEGDPAFVCFNPRIVLPGDELVTLEEACLSFKGLEVKVKRPKVIKVRFQGPDGETYTKTFTGMTSRIFQHELDHLDGITMLNRANSFHRDSALKKWKKFKRMYK